MSEKKFKKTKVEMKEEDKAREPLTKLIFMFKIEGHKTWRLNLWRDKAQLATYLEKNPKHPKITENKWFVVNCIDGTITPE